MGLVSSSAVPPMRLCEPSLATADTESPGPPPLGRTTSDCFVVGRPTKEAALSNAPKKRKQSGTRARVAETHDQGNLANMKIVGVVAALAAVVAIVVLAVIVFGGDDGDRPDGLAFNGAPLPAFVEGEPDPALGQKAPLVVTEYLDDSYAFVGGGGGPNDTAKLMVFVAHWCPTCQAELPEIAAWVDANELPDGVEIVMVSTFPDSSRDNYPPSSWFEREGWDAPVAADSSDGEIAEEFGMSSVPSWVVLTDLNFVLERGVGPLSSAELDRLTSLAAASS